MSNFLFLDSEFPEIAQTARRAEAALRTDSRIACFYARFTLESVVNWIYENDTTLPARYDALNDNLHVPAFKTLLGRAVWEKARLIQKIGNRAVHGNLPSSGEEALALGRELFHVTFWLARTYANAKPADTLAWDNTKVPPSPAQVVKSTRAQVQQLKTDLQAAQEEIANKPAPNDDELEKLRAELAAAKAAAAQTPDAHDYSEKETRDLFIDTLLHEAGWNLSQQRDREYPITDMPNNTGDGFVDYVLWGDDGLPLAVVEAKKTRKDADVGKQQAKLYADCLETQFGRRPLIFYTNGYETCLWDDKRYPPRLAQGFLKKDELEQAIARRSLSTLADVAIDGTIVERAYQTRAIRKYLEALDIINDSGQRKLGVGHFDLVIIDEAHRSVYQKYRAIFEYFDSLLLGLTATPRSEVDHDTYRLFELQDGLPTDAYELTQAVSDGFLVPPKLIACDLKFPRAGIRYDELTEEEKAQWDEKEWGEDGAPNDVAANAVNSWLFNEDTVDKVLATLLTQGIHVAGGDRLGKTIMFARNHQHAKYIVERFDENYPHLAGHFCRVIDNRSITHKA